eukprot:1816602-Prymnesium_polylepis.1
MDGSGAGTAIVHGFAAAAGQSGRELQAAAGAHGRACVKVRSLALRPSGPCQRRTVCTTGRVADAL